MHTPRSTEHSKTKNLGLKQNNLIVIHVRVTDSDRARHEGLTQIRMRAITRTSEASLRLLTHEAIFMRWLQFFLSFFRAREASFRVHAEEYFENSTLNAK